MKITVNFKPFQKALRDVAQILGKSALAKSLIETKDTTTGTQCLLIAKDKSLEIEISHKGLFVQRRIDAIVDEPGSMAVRLDYFSNLKLINETLSITKVDNTINLVSGKFKAKLTITTAADTIEKQRPDFSKVKQTALIRVSVLRAAVQSVDTGASAEENQPIAHMEVSPVGLQLWAHDSYRAALYDNTTLQWPQLLECTVPTGFATTVLGKMDDDCDVTIGVTKSALHMSATDLYVVHPLRQAEIRNIFKLIESLKESTDTFTASMVVDVKDALVTIAGIVSAVTADENRMNMVIDAAGKRVVCQAISTSGEANNQFDLESVTLNKPTDIVVSTKAFTQLLRLVADGKVNMDITEDKVMLSAPDQHVTYVFSQSEA